MRSGKFGMMGTLLASAAIGPMTAVERQRGRYMRAPDHPSAEDEFRAFEQSGDVEVGDGPKPDAEPKPRAGGSGKAPRTKPATQTADAPGVEETQSGEEIDTSGDDKGEDQDAGEADDGDEGEEGERQPKQKPKASERIKELGKRLRAEQRRSDLLESRLAQLEKGGLPTQSGGGNSADIGEAPDPTDSAKYPLGHLDERYVEDRMQYLVKQTAREQADAVLHREQETRQAETQRQQHERLMGQVDDLATRGSEQYDDFQEAVIDTGLKGEWRLDQPTFEAAHEAENGAQILYELSRNKEEAKRVAGLTPYGQMKFVMDRDAEIAKGRQPRKIPSAGAPPQTQTRGANSRSSIKPDTDNLDDFEKAWANDGKRR